MGLRAYAAQGNILPEQTLGRGLRKMYPDDVEEYVSVVGTNAFMDFVESIRPKAWCWSARRWGKGRGRRLHWWSKLTKENEKKDIAALDIEIPVLSPRVYREYKSLGNLDIAAMGHQRLACLKFSEEEQREIVFRTSPTAGLRIPRFSTRLALPTTAA